MNKVTGTWREKIQYSTACLAFLSGQVLTWVQYLQQGEISTGVLGFVAQTLVYSASIYGVSIYIQGKFGEMKTYLKECLTNNESNCDVKLTVFASGRRTKFDKALQLADILY